MKTMKLLIAIMALGGYGYLAWRRGLLAEAEALLTSSAPVGIRTLELPTPKKPEMLLPETVETNEPRSDEHFQDLIAMRDARFWEEINKAQEKYGVAPEILTVLGHKEMDAHKLNSAKHEAHHLKRKDVQKCAKGNPTQAYEYATSHGPFQVMGWHFCNRGLPWTAAYNPEVSVAVAMDVWLDCEDRHKGQSRYKQLYNAFLCYNGSEDYAKDAMDKLTQEVFERRM